MIDTILLTIAVLAIAATFGLLAWVCWFAISCVIEWAVWVYDLMTGQLDDELSGPL